MGIYGMYNIQFISYSVQTDSGAHLASCTMGTGGYFLGDKAVGA
jgi:hypothetical protein